MKNPFEKVNKFLILVFNTRAAGIYMLLFALSIAVATFIENDFGTSSAQKVIFRSWWFELLLFLFSVTILVNIIKFKMIKQKKWTVLLFHASIIIILIGAGVTRYFGFEGMMHIRENNTSNSFLSSNLFLKFKVVKNDVTYDFDEKVLFATIGNNNWHESFLLGNDLIDVSVKEFIPNPKQILTESIDGKPTLKIVVSGINGREEYFISNGETKRIRNIIYNFTENEIPEAINIIFKNESLQFKTNKALTQMVMATQKKDTIYPSNDYKPLKLRSLYSDGVNNFVLSEFNKRGKVSTNSENQKVQSQSLTALLMNISVNGKTKQAYIYGQKGLAGRPQVLHFDALNISVTHGAKEVTLPFSIKLNKFILDKYPGTNSASSYASEVQLIDNKKNIKKDFRIYMNNILNYGGYRFFQSSFDKDEKGTYLSVNHDFWGTLISYLGYALLTLGMILTLFSKKTRFYQVIQKIKKLRAKSSTYLLTLFLLSSAISFAQLEKENLNVKYVVDIDHANKFSTLIVQDYKGRMKPVQTLSSELLRKLSRKESLYGLTADQIVLSMFVNNKDWYGVDIIKLGKHKDIQRKLGINTEYASYKDFFLKNGEYKLRDEVRRVYNLKPIDRGVYEKELLKIDEKLNILSMMFSGSLLKIIPDTNEPNNAWVSNHDHGHDHGNEINIADTFFSAYSTALKKGMRSDNYTDADKLLEELKDFQNKKGGSIMPSPTKIKSEIFLNKTNVFNRLALLYMLLGIGFLFFLFLSVFKPTINLKIAYVILFSLVVLGFVFHTIGLGLRWYVSGRAPWSNGYESMIYIAWTTTLAGVLFTRKSLGGLAATMVLAATILLVSMLSFLDPEITPLVPVLKSYWLTIHVSLEAGSYGFLMLGAIIGLINLILMIFLNGSNKIRTKRIIKEMTYISELTLIGGLFMVSIGTYLGGVWANESWGTYWGWDAKETWA
ncbi:MAG: cytochrome C biogenesis protein, partial [Bacteroidetes bacterium]